MRSKKVEEKVREEVGLNKEEEVKEEPKQVFKVGGKRE